MIVLDLLVVGLFGVSLLRWLVTVAAALGDWARGRTPPPAVPDARVTVLVPAHDEERGLEGTLRALAASGHPGLEVVVVDDGSTDATAAIASRLAVELPGLRVVRQPANLGKARALCEGARVARGEVVVTVDADTRVEPGAIGRLVAAMEEGGLAAAAGNVKVGNREGWLTRWQALEYVSGLQFERRAQARLSCITTVPGAFGAFRATALERAGLFPTGTLAEDTDLTLALQQAGEKVGFCPEAVAWTEAPVTLDGLIRQRTRWLQGNLQCAFKHVGAFRGPRRWGLRLYGLPSFWYGHLVTPLLLPVALAWLGRALALFPAREVAATALLLVGMDLLTALAGVVMDREDRRLVPFVLAQRFLQPLVLLFAFVRVLARVARGEHRSWERVPRWGGWRAPALR